MLDLFLDMDGVLANWEKAAAAACGIDISQRAAKFQERLEELGMTFSELWKTVNATEGFWENIPALPHAKRLVEELNGLGELRVCTSPTTMNPERDDNCWATFRRVIEGKLAWLESMEITTIPMIPIADKFLLAGHRRVLIDDMLGKCEPWVDAGGVAIEFPGREAGVEITHEDAVDWTVKQVARLVSGYPAKPTLVRYDDDNP